MGLESTNLISGLRSDWPLEIDPTSEGNEHLQVIKDVLQNTFAGRDGDGNAEGGWDGVLTVNPEEINHLNGLDQNLNDKLTKIDGLIDEVGGNVSINEDNHVRNIDLHTKDALGILHSYDEGDGTIRTSSVLSYLPLMDLLYPVGTGVWVTTDVAEDPNVRFPETTWERVATNRLIGGASPDGSQYEDAHGLSYDLKEGGDDPYGVWAHPLTEEEMPRHNHYARNPAYIGETGSEIWVHGNYERGTPSQAVLDNLKTAGAGGDPDNNDETVAHNNLPPYFGMYFWKRLT